MDTRRRLRERGQRKRLRVEESDKRMWWLYFCVIQTSVLSLFTWSLIPIFVISIVWYLLFPCNNSNKFYLIIHL